MGYSFVLSLVLAVEYDALDRITKISGAASLSRQITYCLFGQHPKIAHASKNDHQRNNISSIHVKPSIILPFNWV